MEPKREFAIIEMMKEILAPSSGKIKVGIGDDAAVVDPQLGKAVFSTDILVEDVHFRRKFHPPRLLGEKAVAVNVSDINAMGGRAEFALMGLAIPPAIDNNYLKEIGRGIAKGCRHYGLETIGGDITSSPGPFFINLVVWGTVEKPILRSGARPGDDIWVTGTLGDSRAGLLWLSEEAGEKELELLKENNGEKVLNEHLYFLGKAHLVPQVYHTAGPLLSGIVNSMIDISDGLASDLGHICSQSSTGAQIIGDQLPLSSALTWWAGERGKNPREIALQGGEDYQLLFSAPREREKEIESTLNAQKIAATRIGKIQEKALGINYSDEMGCRPLQEDGWDHFG